MADDGLPKTPGSVTVQWTLATGPAEVIFDDPMSPATTASFPTAGSYVIHLTATDGDLIASDELTVTVSQDSPANPVGLVIEAESGWLSDPMLVGTNSDASTLFITTVTPEAGAASYGLDVRESGEYVIWARVLASGTTNETFYVSADEGVTNVLRANADDSGTNTWHWVRVTVSGVTTKGVSSPLPHRFAFDTGYHTVTVTGGDSGMLLDKFIVTNDPNFVPTETVLTPPAPVISNLAFTPNGGQVTWSTIVGLSYRLVYKDNLTDSQWLPASPEIVAFGDNLTWTDETAGASSRRFYSILVVR